MSILRTTTAVAVPIGALLGGALGAIIAILVLSSEDLAMKLYFAACQAGGCEVWVVAIFGGATAAGALLGALIAAALTRR